MNPVKILIDLNTWFEKYIHRFDTSNQHVQRNMDLKAAHTLRVCRNIRDIGESLDFLSQHDLAVAETAALLHDIGRFEQYRRYRTFVDRKSENHAALGVRIIRENHLLESFDRVTADSILRAVACHNRLALPKNADPHFLLLLKMLRDADKLDIWRVVTEYYQQSANDRNPAIELDLPDEDTIAEPVSRALMRGELVQMADMKSLNDFKLLQIGWIYDVNFTRTFQIVKEKRYLETIRDVLPQNAPIIDTIMARVQVFITVELNKQRS